MPIRVSIDSCVIIDGLISDFSSSKAVLILGLHRVIQLIIPEFVIRETEMALRKVAHDREKPDILEAFRLFVKRLNPEITPLPGNRELEAFRSAIHHQPDVPVLVSVLKSKPDYFLTKNISHFDQKVAQKTGLTILRPEDFLKILSIGMQS